MSSKWVGVKNVSFVVVVGSLLGFGSSELSGIYRGLCGPLSA